jgi:hypothetical protein
MGQIQEPTKAKINEIGCYDRKIKLRQLWPATMAGILNIGNFWAGIGYYGRNLNIGNFWPASVTMTGIEPTMGFKWATWAKHMPSWAFFFFFFFFSTDFLFSFFFFFFLSVDFLPKKNLQEQQRVRVRTALLELSQGTARVG